MPDPGRPGEAGGREEPLPSRITMPLLTLITQQSLDEDYVHAARRRAAVAEETSQPPQRRRPSRTAAVVGAVFGIMVATAAVQTSRNADVDDASRTTLITRIVEQRDAVARQQSLVSGLREGNSDLEEVATRVAADQQDTVERLRRLQVRTGFVPVRGGGVRLVVDDPETGDEMVRDEDLGLLVNALWAAGAEAVSVNGHRLSVLTALSNSGPAINVDLSPLGPPYTIEAIGDVRTMQADLVATSTFRIFNGIAASTGFTLDRQNVENISMPAARSKALTSTTVDTDTDLDDRSNEETQR